MQEVAEKSWIHVVIFNSSDNRGDTTTGHENSPKTSFPSGNYHSRHCMQNL